MRHIDTITGTGVVVSNKGKNPVEYELEIWEEHIRVATLENPTASVPGMQQIRGSIHPVRVGIDEVATLELQDGRTLPFFYSNSGTTEITPSGGFKVSMNLENFIEGNYCHIVLRVRQKEDCLKISVYDPRSALPDKPIWESESHDFEDTKKTAVVAARGYLSDTSTPFANPVWKKRQ